MIKNYDCRNAYIPIDKIDYFEELDLGIESFESAEILSNSKKFGDAYIILYKSLQNFGNAVLINRFGLRSKSKNCQFQYLYDENILTDQDLEMISKFSEFRNDVYYNNRFFLGLNEEEYLDKKNLILNLIEKLKEEIK